jgi:SP family sugar:H+ symporter-like MFS transporter
MSTIVEQSRTPGGPTIGSANPSPPARALWYVLFFSSIAAIGGFLFGFDSGVINGTVDALSLAFGTRAAATGFAVASVLVGCAFGAFGAGSLADRIGRRPTMIVNAVAFLISAFATGAANSAAMFVAARLVGGVGIGAASVLAPMYISEIAPPRLRGRLASLQQLAIVLGLFFAFLSNDVLARMAGGAAAPFWLGAPAWRWMFWMEVIPSAAFLIGVLIIPESPRFLVAAGKRDRALQVFRRVSVPDAESLVQKVEDSLRGETRAHLSDLLDPRTRRPVQILWVGMGLATFQQLVGINIIFYFGAVLWQAAGASEQAALRIDLLTGVVNILATFLAMGLIDRWGRKPLLFIGSIGMAVTLTVMAIVFATAGNGAEGRPEVSRFAAVIGLFAANLYILAFGVSWGPVMWVLLGEMFPNRFRGAALAVSGATNWAANFAVTVTFLPLLKGAGLATAYGLYALAAIVSAVFVRFSVQETKGRTLEDM